MVYQEQFYDELFIACRRAKKLITERKKKFDDEAEAVTEKMNIIKIKFNQLRPIQEKVYNYVDNISENIATSIREPYQKSIL